MTKEYRTVYEGGEGEVVEKKSRFIASVRPVSTEEEALAFIETIRKKHWNASHNCFAYVIGERSELARYSDDGEPGGTAGKPMLDVLKGEALCNTAVVVTRYFGGTLLGTGGLVRAYSQAVKEGLASSVIITKIRGVKLKIATDYTGLGKSCMFRDHGRDKRTGIAGSRRELLVCTDWRTAGSAGRIEVQREGGQVLNLSALSLYHIHFTGDALFLYFTGTPAQ